MTVPLQHPAPRGPAPTVADLHAMILEMRAVLFAMAHEVAQTGAGGPDTCLRAVLARVAPLPAEAVADQAGQGAGGLH